MGNTNERNKTMFIKLRIMAHEALKKAMLDNDRTPLFDHTIKVIYDTIKTAETDDGFANALDCECADAFDEQTADGYDDLLELFTHMSDGLKKLLVCNDIIED